MALSVVLGTPEIYTQPDEIRRTLSADPMDVCAFVGVAPRGPCRVPVEPEFCVQDKILVEKTRKRQRSVAIAVESWDQYQLYFGGFEGPGRLPYAVASFFEQGGRRAYIVRVVHAYNRLTEARVTLDNDDYNDDLLGLARLSIPQLRDTYNNPITLEAKYEGSWASALKAAVNFSARPLVLLDGCTQLQLHLSPDQQMLPGSLLRLSRTDILAPENNFEELRFAANLHKKGAANTGECENYLSFFGGTLPAVPNRVEIITAGILLYDSATNREEYFDQLGLCSCHPRWLASVLYRDSEWVNPTENWIDTELTISEPEKIGRDVRSLFREQRARGEALTFSHVEDRYQDIVPQDFFSTVWTITSHEACDGVHALAQLQDLAMLVVPDLYVPEQLPSFDDHFMDDLLSSVEFEECVDIAISSDVATPELSLPGLYLNPLNTEDLKTIITLQKKLVDFADSLHEFTALIDVPPQLNKKQIMSWRTQFQSAYAAAYHPWVNISDLSDQRDTLIKLNPSALAAGTIASKERKFSLSHGAANERVLGAVSVVERVSPQLHDVLHLLHINVFSQERDGIWLTAARTLSRNSNLRQLSVQRFMVMLRGSIKRQMQWVAFEPNRPTLWVDIRFKLISFLSQLYHAGAFKGRCEREAYFVHCDAALNTRQLIDAGKLIIEVGVAPAEPLEFIVLRIKRGADGALTVET